MNLFTLYQREKTKTSLIPALIMGSISGLAQASLLGIITIAADTVSYDNLNFRYLCLFAIAFVVMHMTKQYSLKQANTIAEELIHTIRVRLSDKIRQSELLFLERLGKGYVYNKLTHDTNLISETALVMIYASQSALVLVCCLLFVALLSRTAFFITVGLCAIGASGYIIHEKGLEKKLAEVRKNEGRFFETIDQILNGFKELKMNRKKSEDYFGVFKHLAHTTQSLKIEIETNFITDLLFSQVAFYSMLGAIVFLLPWFEQTDSENIIRITAAVLFIIGPTEAVVGAIPSFFKATVAVRRLYQLEEQLDVVSHAHQSEEDVPPSPITSFEELALEHVEFSYTAQDDRSTFTVGPLDLTVRQGEILFLIGGNGCGKTTLLKLLTGLYYPDEGSLTINGKPVDKSNYQAYRELFSLIFMEFHLFHKLYGLDDIDASEITALLQLMELEKKTQVVDGVFTHLDLSTGQRKRLAMLVALLEDRPIYVFDEWAADQDPHFRKYFYEELLHELKARGKTIIAVSHDDRYFHVADRAIKMEYGQVIDGEGLQT